MENGPDRSTPWGLILILLVLGVIGAGFIGKTPPALPDIRSDLSVGMVTAGWIVSIFAAFGTATGMFAGSLGDRFGHTRVIITALGVLALGAFVGVLANGAAMLMLSRAIEGIGYIALMVALPSLIGYLASDRNRGLAVGLWSCVTPSGMAIAMVASPYILEPFGWRGIWLMTTIIPLCGIIAFVLILRGRPKTQVPSGSSYLANIRLTVTRPGPWILAICFSTYTFQWIAVMVWLPTFVVEERGLNVGLAATLAAAAVAMNILGNFAAAWLAHWRVRLWLMLTIGTIVMGGSSLLIFPDYLPDLSRFALVMIFSFVGALQPVALLACAPWLAPSPGQLGATNGLMYQGSQLGNLIGPPIVAFAVVTSGKWADAGYVLFALTIINIVLAQKLRILEKNRPVGKTSTGI